MITEILRFRMSAPIYNRAKCANSNPKCSKRRHRELTVRFGWGPRISFPTSCVSISFRTSRDISNIIFNIREVVAVHLRAGTCDGRGLAGPDDRRAPGWLRDPVCGPARGKTLTLPVTGAIYPGNPCRPMQDLERIALPRAGVSPRQVGRRQCARARSRHELPPGPGCGSIERSRFVRRL